MIKTINQGVYRIATYVYTEEEKKRVEEIMNELKQIFQCKTVSFGFPDGIRASDYQDMVIKLDGCYMPFAKKMWR